MSKSLTDLWYDEFSVNDKSGFKHCGLCGNRGIIHIEGMYTPARQLLETLHAYCICPNGRAMKKGKAKI